MHSRVNDMHVRQVTLSNGLSVYLSENHEQPSIAARIVVRAGAADDPSDRTGIAHYLEHMLANKGSQALGTVNHAEEAPLLNQLRELYDQLAVCTNEAQTKAIYEQIDAVGLAASRYVVPNELKQLYGLLGARRLNAFTSHDQTAYVVEIPSNRLPHWARLEGDRFRHPVFRSFQTEVETVFEEKNRSLDDHGRRVSSALREALWGKHPYSRPILGYREHLRRPSISQMESFFKTWYVPNNMAIVLAGALDSDQALRLIEENFGDLPARPLPPRNRPQISTISQGGSVTTVHAPGVQEVRLGWQTVPYGHPERPAGVLADMLLDNRATGLLNQNLVILQRVRAAGAHPMFMRGAGAQILWGRPRDGQSLDEVTALLLEQVAKLQAGDFREETLQGILGEYEQAYQKGLEENSGRAGLMMRAFLHERPWQGAFAELDALRAVTADQIVSFARTWLTDQRVTVHRVHGQPQQEPPLAPPISGRSVSTTHHSAFFEQIRQLPATPIPLKCVEVGRDVFRHQTGSGLTLTSAPNPFNDLCQLVIRSPIGHRRAPVWSLASSLWSRSGTATRDVGALRSALYQMGVQIALSSGPRLSAMKIMGPEARLPEALAFLKERICTPHMPTEEARRLIADVIDHRRQIRGERRVLEQALQGWLLEGEHSAHLGGALSDTALQQLDVQTALNQLQRLWGTCWDAMYVGRRRPSDVVSLLSREAEVPPWPSLPNQHYRSHATSQIWLVHHPSVQASVAVLCPWGQRRSGDSLLHRLYGEYMGGSAGLIFQEIREARGMAYSAHGGWRMGWQDGDDNLLWASVGTQADKAAEVTALLLGMLRAFPYQPRRALRARMSMMERLQTSRFRFRDLPGVVAGWHRHGFQEDPRPARIAQLQSVTDADMVAFAETFADAPMQVAIVGDLEQVDRSALAALADVQEVDTAHLFVQ